MNGMVGEGPAAPEWFTVGVGVFLGLIFGSFATALSHRVPRGESLGGRSRCPACGRQIGIAENIPLLSWIFLRGRCRGCRARISVRYPLTEGVTAALFALAAWKFGLTLEALVYAGFFWLLVALTVIDLEHKLLPNRIVYPAFVAGWIGLALVALVDGELSNLLEAVIGAAIFGGFFLIVGLIVPAAMGGGDIKLAFVLGSFLGFIGAPGVVLVGMFLAFLIGGLTGLALKLFAGATGKTQIPFGPFLAAGSVIAVLAGQRLLDLYLGRL